MPTTGGRTWQFKARFRRHAFGWKSQPAITRVREAVVEIKQVARTDPIDAAEGAVTFLERLSPALENIDSSSGAVGTAVNHAIAELVPIIAAAPADATTRAEWLERLFEAHAADQIPYIGRLADYWGALRGYFHGTSACLSALLAAGRYDELIELVEAETFWPYKRWAVKALAAQGQNGEAIRYAERCRSPWASDPEIEALCEQILLSSGHVEEAYAGMRSRRTVGEPTGRGSEPSRRSIRTRACRPSWPISCGKHLATRASGSLRPRTPGCSTRRSRSPIRLRATQGR